MANSGPFVFLNGRFVARTDATLDIEDRGSLFGDGVYEVLRYYEGKALAMDAHVERLCRSLNAIRLNPGNMIDTIGEQSDSLARRNGFENALMYWHVSRGSAPRSHPIPDNITPTILMIAYPEAAVTIDTPPQEVAAAFSEDVRWHHCSIKSLMLLPAVLAQDSARRSGDDHAILHRGSTVTEGAAHNVFAIREGVLWTHPADQWILAGITRQLVIDIARTCDLIVREEAFTTTFLKNADEVLLTGTSTHVAAVVRLDDTVIGDGHAGPVSRQLQRGLMEMATRQP